jgi:tRNA(Ile)-lysidine synthase
MPRSNVVETVLRECRGDHVLSLNPRVVVAVSGGPDSTALLHALTRVAPRLKLELTAAHLDHGLRRGSAADARAVAALCDRLKVPLVSRRTSPPNDAEEAARELRHAYLETVAADLGAATVALGHTADDQAETVVLHLIRGSGLEGLAAMQVREGLRFRPLLGTWREDVQAHCLKHGLHPVEDPTNRSPRFARNRVRRQLIPVMETFNPQVKSSLVRLATAAREEHEVVTEQAMSWLAKQVDGLDRPGFKALPTAVGVESLRLAWGRALGGRAMPGGAERLEQAMRVLSSPRQQATLPLGRGLVLYVREDRFSIGPKSPE